MGGQCSVGIIIRMVLRLAPYEYSPAPQNGGQPAYLQRVWRCIPSLGCSEIHAA